jgi:phosphatidate phosphatase LPIN
MVRINETLYGYKEACKILTNLLDSKSPLLNVSLEKAPSKEVLSPVGNRYRSISPSERRGGFNDVRLRALTPQPKSSDFSMEIKSAGGLAQSAMIRPQPKDSKLGRIKIKKTLRPSSELLMSLDLKPGMNTITYQVRTGLQGHQTISGNIYLWPHDAKVVISDVDGTVTRSDFLGQVMPFVGKDWSQPGIAPLYTNVRRNGYYIMYLTSRAIGQSKQTKDFLQSVYQDGKMLPLGPVVMSPDRLISSFKREVVFRRPEKFKIATLKDIKKLFPADYSPFYAGFGNRETDSISYRAVGVSFDKIYIINPQGNIHQYKDDEVKSYASINSKVKEVFPMVFKDRVIIKSNKNSNTPNTLNLQEQQIGDSDSIKVTSKNF